MKIRILITLILLSLSTLASASWIQGYQRETGGNGFRIVKQWGGSAGTTLRIEYYGYLAERCNAGSGSGHVNNLNFFISLNGRKTIVQETSCELYNDNGTGKTYAVSEVKTPQFFEGIDREANWHLEIYIKSIYGDYDSQYGQNYHFDL